jgi:hypothetical protein|tara:strand:- start:397 stop:681 length:285 start_codon:yes stop_codon:yes gene_type:complete
MKKVDKIKIKILPLLKKRGIARAGIFGSITRGENKKNSDIDILIKAKKNLSLLDIIKIKIELEKLLKKKVDLVEYETIKPLIKKQILNEEVRIL